MSAECEPLLTTDLQRQQLQIEERKTKQALEKTKQTEALEKTKQGIIELRLNGTIKTQEEFSLAIKSIVETFLRLRFPEIWFLPVSYYNLLYMYTI